MTQRQLYAESIRIILRYQAPSGAYVASPNFPSYRYSWLRDGSFIAHAMDRVGEYDSARAFFRWIDRTLRRHAGKVERLLGKLARGEVLGEGDYLHTRFTLQGEEARDAWWNFQLDGYGSWLWALAEHVQLAGDRALLAEVASSIVLSLRYLGALWQTPNYDCWEEHPEHLHPYTLAAIYGGLRAAAGLGVEDGEQAAILVEDIRRFVLSHGVCDGHLVKSFAPGPRPTRPAGFSPAAVDASLLGILVPYRMLPAGDRIAQATVAAIERDLHRPGGGVYRYQGDTYYGGGEWTLLAAWLGWYYVEMSVTARARELLRWVEAQADEQGALPEQVSPHLLEPGRYAEWEARWGPIAKPLLWSHAMYLILADALERHGG